MPIAIQRHIILLFICILVIAGIAGFFGYQTKKLTDENLSLQDQIKQSQNQNAEIKKSEEKAIADAQALNQRISELNQNLNAKEKENSQLQSSKDDLSRKLDSTASEIEQANKERDDWKGRLETLRQERDDLMKKLQNMPEKIVYKDRPVETSSEENISADNSLDENYSATENTSTAAMSEGGEAHNDQYWANILKLKAGLEVKLDKARADLDKSALEVADLKKENTVLELQIKNLTNDKADIERRLINEKKLLEDNYAKEKQDLKRKIRDGEDLASNLSMEVARARGDQKSANDFGSKFKEDNSQLQTDLKRLSSTKVALEKTVARLTQEKNEMGKKLADTEGVIQDRINEIWQIKQNLDQKITQMSQVKDKNVELPPIIVNASRGEVVSEMPNSSNAGLPKQWNKVISINPKNHFVIVDLGETQGSSIGRILKVNRGGKEIATLEVIQVRRDISAADIKDQKANIQVGDQVQ